MPVVFNKKGNKIKSVLDNSIIELTSTECKKFASDTSIYLVNKSKTLFDILLKKLFLNLRDS